MLKLNLNAINDFISLNIEFLYIVEQSPLISKMLNNHYYHFTLSDQVNCEHCIICQDPDAVLTERERESPSRDAKLRLWKFYKLRTLSDIRKYLNVRSRKLIDTMSKYNLQEFMDLNCVWHNLCYKKQTQTCDIYEQIYLWKCEITKRKNTKNRRDKRNYFLLDLLSMSLVEPIKGFEPQSKDGLLERQHFSPKQLQDASLQDEHVQDMDIDHWESEPGKDFEFSERYTGIFIYFFTHKKTSALTGDNCFCPTRTPSGRQLK